MMRLVRRDGALTIRDIEDDVLVDKEHLWASRKPSKRALEIRLLHRRAGDQRAQRHAEDLRADDAAFRLGQAAEGRHRRRETAAYLLDRALRAQGVVSLDSICHLDAPRKAAVRKLIERARAPRRAGAGRDRRRRQAGALGARRRRWTTAEPADAGPGPHPLAVRSADHPAQAHRNCSSATTTSSRPMCRRRSGSSAISPCRCWSATASSPRSI